MLSAKNSDDIDIELLGKPQLDVFDVGDGLPDLTIVSVSATPQGQIWAGTMQGLARFNGLRFMPVEMPLVSAIPNMINSVLALDNNEVWVAPSNSGILLWNGRQWRHFNTGNGFPSLDVRRIRAFETRRGRRVYATSSAGVIAEWDGQHWSEFKINYTLAGKQIFDILLVPGKTEQDDVTWIGTYDAGLIRCQGTAPCTEQRVAGRDRFFDISSLRSVRESDGSTSIWAGSYGGGVARLSKGHWQLFNAEEQALTGNYVHDLEITQDPGTEPQVWVGARNGLSRYRHGQWQRYSNEDEISKSRVRALAIGHDFKGRQQLLAGTDKGLLRFQLHSDWRTVSRLGEDGNGIWAVLFERAENGQERLWLGTDGDGLWRYQLGQWTHMGAEQGLPSPTVRSIVRLPSGPLWVGLWGGQIAVQQGDVFKTLITPWPKDQQQAINTMLPDGKGGVWVGLRNSGAAYFNGRTWQWFNPVSTGVPNRIYSFVMSGSDADPVLWASSKSEGLARYYRGQWRSFKMWNSEVPDDTLSMLKLYPDRQKRPIIWAGSSSQGVVRLDISDINRPRLVKLPILPKPPHHYVYGAIQNSKGDVVLCTDYGAAAWHNLGDDNYQAINYHRSNGLPHDECNGGAMNLDQHDRVWIGTIGGAAVHTPSANDSRAAPLSLTRLRFNRRDQDISAPTHSFMAPSADSSIDLEFSMLIGERESETRYRTQIIGLDTEPGPWLQSNQRNFSAVPSGDYELKVEAEDFAGRQASAMQIKFNIPTPWWRTWWAIALQVLVVVVAMLLFVNWRERSLRRRQIELRNLVADRTAELEKRGVELHQKNDELSRLSYFDPLTEVANRRKLLDSLQAEWQYAQDNNQSLAFILLDADEFKTINDVHGHMRGDECLQLITKQLESVLRISDSMLLGRYGGEEFGIVLPKCNLEQAMAVAERCRQAVECIQLKDTNGKRSTVTISLGVASMRPKPGESNTLIIASADAALNRAKQKGKNRSEAADVE